MLNKDFIAVLVRQRDNSDLENSGDTLMMSCTKLLYTSHAVVALVVAKRYYSIS